MKNMRQKQAGRTTADDRHLGSRRRFHCRWDLLACPTSSSAFLTHRGVLKRWAAAVAAPVPPAGQAPTTRRQFRQRPYPLPPSRPNRPAHKHFGISDKGRSKRLILSQPLISIFRAGGYEGAANARARQRPQNRSKSGSFAMIDRDPLCFIARQLLHRSAHEPCARFSTRVRVHVPSEQIYRSRA